MWLHWPTEAEVRKRAQTIWQPDRRLRAEILDKTLTMGAAWEDSPAQILAKLNAKVKKFQQKRVGVREAKKSELLDAV